MKRVCIRASPELAGDVIDQLLAGGKGMVAVGHAAADKQAGVPRREKVRKRAGIVGVAKSCISGSVRISQAGRVAPVDQLVDLIGAQQGRTPTVVNWLRSAWA